MPQVDALAVAIDARLAAAGAAQFNTAAASMGTSATAATTKVNAMRTAVLGLMGGMIGFMAIKKAVSTIVEFEKAMTMVKTVTDETTEVMQKMTKVARELGATTRYTASEAGEGMLALARAGFDADTVMKAIPQTLSFATAAAIDLGEASDFVANTLRQFGLDASDTARATDALLVVANNANTDVTQMGEALKYAGTVSGAMGLELEEVTAALGVMANQGLKGSLAGTQFRGVMAALIKPTEKAAKAIGRMNLNARQLNPAVHGISKVMKTLKQGMESMGNEADAAAAVLDIFGRRPMAAAIAMADFNETIIENIGLQKQMAGYTAETAATMENTLYGRIKAMSAAFEELFLAAGDNGFSSVLRGMVDLITSTARAFGNATTETDRFQSVAKVLAVVLKLIMIRLTAILMLKFGGWILATVMSLGKLITTIKRATASMRAFKVVMAANWVGLVATAIAALITMWLEYAGAQDRAREAAEELAETERRIAESRVAAAATAGTVSEIKNLTAAYTDLQTQMAKTTKGFDWREGRLLETGQTGQLGKTYKGTRQVPGTGLKPGLSARFESFTGYPTRAASEWAGQNAQLATSGEELVAKYKALLADVSSAYDTAVKDAGDFGSATTEQLREVVQAGSVLQNTLVGLTSDEVAKVFETLGEPIPNFEKRVREVGGVLGTVRGQLDEFTKYNESGKGLGGENQITAIDTGVKALEKYNQTLQFELSIVNQSADAQKRARIEREVTNKAIRAGLEEGDLLVGVLQRTAVALYEQSEAQRKLNEKKTQYERISKATQTSLESELAAMQTELALLNMTANSTQELANAKEQETLLRKLNAQLIGLEGEELTKAQETITQMIALLGQLQEAKDAAMGPSGVAQQTSSLVTDIAALTIEMEQGADAADRYRYRQEALAMATHLTADAHKAEVEALMAKYDEYQKLLEKKKQMDEQSLISNEEFARAVTSSVMSVVTGASTMQEAFLGLIQTLVEMIIQALIFKAIMAAIGGPAAAAGGGGGVAKGGVFSGGQRETFQGYARGGIVDRPTRFGMYGSGGVMGEAGSEAVMPLTRLPDGRLGVASEGGSSSGNIMINMTVNTQDADSFRKSKKQITRELSRGIRQNTTT